MVVSFESAEDIVQDGVWDTLLSEDLSQLNQKELAAYATTLQKLGRSPHGLSPSSTTPPSAPLLYFCLTER